MSDATPGAEHRVQLERVRLVPATPEDIPRLRNMSHLYAYDISEHMGADPDWSLSEDGSYDSGIDIPAYFSNPGAHPFVIRHGEQLVGFAIVDKHRCEPGTDFNMGQFYVARNLTRKGIGRLAATRLFDDFAGTWQVTVLVGNHRGLHFWESIITDYARGAVDRSMRLVPDEVHVFRFRSGPRADGAA